MIRACDVALATLFAVACLAAPVPVDAAEPYGSAAISTPTLEGASAAVDAFHAALARGDAAGAAALLDDNVRIFEQGWVERSRAEYAGHHLPSDIKFSQAVTSVRTARSGSVLGDLAYVASENRATGKFEGKDIDSISIETMVLKRTPTGWRIVHIHWSSRKAKS